MDTHYDHNLDITDSDHPYCSDCETHVHQPESVLHHVPVKSDMYQVKFSRCKDCKLQLNKSVQEMTAKEL